VNRGEVWVVDLDPVVGSEAAKTRRCIIVSNDARNAAARRSERGVLTIVPLTSNVARVLPFQVLIPPDADNGLTQDSKAQAEQVRAADFARFVTRVGVLQGEQIAAIDEALALHLALW
jgi:mRNA interferase MazF